MMTDDGRLSTLAMTYKCANSIQCSLFRAETSSERHAPQPDSPVRRTRRPGHGKTIFFLITMVALSVPARRRTQPAWRSASYRTFGSAVVALGIAAWRHTQPAWPTTGYRTFGNAVVALGIAAWRHNQPAWPIVGYRTFGNAVVALGIAAWRFTQPAWPIVGYRTFGGTVVALSMAAWKHTLPAWLSAGYRTFGSGSDFFDELGNLTLGFVFFVVLDCGFRR